MPLKMKLTRLPNLEKSMGFFISEITYRVALPVTRIVRYPTFGNCFPLCPRCEKSLEREYMSYCDRCGQKLNWDFLSKAKIIEAPIIYKL